MTEHMPALALVNTVDAEHDYKQAVVDAITNHPRSLQKEIGPSEIGTPCARLLGYKLLGTPQRAQKPNWKATVGTSIHMWLEEVFDQANLAWAAQHGSERWLIEERVTVGAHLDGTPITGSCDLYDRATRTVIDHKTCGPTVLKDRHRTGDVGATYRTQAHLYGLGWLQRGMPVDHVAICSLPRNGDLSEAHWWTEPFRPRIAAEALQRLQGVESAIQAAGTNALAALPTADVYCVRSCPFYRPASTDLAVGCPGHPIPEMAPTTSALTLTR